MKKLIRGTLATLGYEIRRLPREADAAAAPRTESDAARHIAAGMRKAHYGSAGRLLDGWMNIDLGANAAPNYLQADLTARHPFPDGWLTFGFAEDFLEHLDQEQSLRFLVEARRAFQPGGVLRLSYPSLEGVLRKHYMPPTFETAALAASEAYSMWGHKHFYSLDEIATVAKHVGFRETRIERFGESRHAELRGLDSRADQADLNAVVELGR